MRSYGERAECLLLYALNHSSLPLSDTQHNTTQHTDELRARHDGFRLCQCSVLAPCVIIWCVCLLVGLPVWSHQSFYRGVEVSPPPSQPPPLSVLSPLPCLLPSAQPDYSCPEMSQPHASGSENIHSHWREIQITQSDINCCCVQHLSSPVLF